MVKEVETKHLGVSTKRQIVSTPSFLRRGKALE
jgi:UDP-glucose 6-dehydrogenase